MNILANSGGNFITNMAICFIIAATVAIALGIREWFSNRKKLKTERKNRKESSRQQKKLARK